jgi:hypothetical protein
MQMFRRFEVSVAPYGEDDFTVIDGPWEYAQTEDECEKIFREVTDGLYSDYKVSIDRF